MFKEVNKYSPTFGVHCVLFDKGQLNKQITVDDQITEF